MYLQRRSRKRRKLSNETKSKRSRQRLQESPETVTLNDEDMADDTTSDSDCFTDVINVNKLKNLTHKMNEPDKVLEKLLTPRFGLIERLKRGSNRTDLTELLIHVIAVACNSKKLDLLTPFLKHINGSKFLRDSVVLFLNRYLSGQEPINMEVLVRIIEILRRLVTIFPSRSLDIVTQLSAPIHYLQNSTTAEISFNELDQELKWVVKHRLLGVPTRDAEEEEEFISAIKHDYKCISIAPTCEDMKEKGDPYLRKNKVFTRYTNVNDYLDVQFRLLREDLIRPLREGLADLLESRQEGNDKKRKSVLKVYQKVQIVSWRCSQNGVTYKIHFDTSRLKRVRWSAGKRLIFGSLVCLSADQFQTMLIGTIAERNPNDLSNGIVFVNFENETTQVNSIQFNCYYEMIESPAYYEPYKNVLGVLQYLDEETLPFQKYLLNQGQGEIPPPKYIRCTHHKFNFTPAMKRVEKKCIEQEENFQLEENQVSILTPSTWPSAEQLGLDDSQYGALTAALTKEFAVIQGPPGTGKTFIGVLVVQLLLANKYKPVYHLMDAFENRQPIFGREPLWDGPILIVCYTNHALDQFLEEIIKQHPKKVNDNKIVRLGGRCSSENPILKRCQLNEIMRQSKWRKAIGWARSRLSEMENQLTCLAAFVELAREEMLHENVLKDFMSHGQFEMLTRRKGWEPSVLVHWLYAGRRNTWQSTVLRDAAEDAFIQEEAGCYDDQWDEEPGRQSDVDNRNSMIDFGECKEIMRGNAFLIVSQESIYFNAWQSLRKIHKRFQQTRPFYDVNVWDLSLDDRWRLYNYWVSRCISENMTAWQTVLHDHSQEKRKLDTLINNQHCDILADAEIVAMTTTVAAKNNHLLKKVKPKIVIVEEAAEVLEAHIVASLSDDCEHLILIGDHQQLRPKPADDRLAKHYWLQISLFERMLLNKMKCECLAIQHRMRPEISKLLVPHIYKSLRDHSNVHEYENIVGVMGNLFFLNHSFQESSVDDLKSHSNEHEASFIAAFCKYLLNIGYSSDKITVLTLYTGQLFLLRKYMPKKDFEGVRITPVDNFQGEENDIILLSLVRSNKRNNIGFLGISNRVCVALSRARKGLYIIGNGDLLRDTSPLWRDILDTMRSEKKLVEKIPLGCRKHPDNVFHVSCAADFNEVPAFGCKHICKCLMDCGHVCERICHEQDPCHKGFKYPCNYPCEYRLDCGHVCERKCHVREPGHKGYKCMKPCLRKPKRCRSDHSCLKVCHLKCGNCPMPVERTVTRCQHTVTMKCHRDENNYICREPCKRLCPVGHKCKNPCFYESCVCTEPVKRKLIKCQHEVSIPCNENERLNARVEQFKSSFETSDEEALIKAEAFYYCHEPCKKSCGSGHPCVKQCYEDCNVLCTVMTEKILPSCQHKAIVACNRSVESYQCQNRCEKTCQAGHKCTRLCSETCMSCQVLVIKTVPVCNHTANVPCYLDPFQFKCKQPCEKYCPVGHRCVKKCGEQCGDCTVQVVKNLPKCRHTVKLECDEDPEDAICQKLCEKFLLCGHQCQEICGADNCSQFCKAPVDRALLCEHIVNLPCSEDSTDYLCCEQVEVKTCEDGHTKMIDCHRRQDELEECTTPLELTCSTNPNHNFTIPCHTLKSISSQIIGCPNTCKVKLDCGHLCRDKCEDCACAGEHSVCRDTCSKQQPLCLHKCEGKCGSPCRPCMKPLTAKSRCPHVPIDTIAMCSETTELCKQRCKWSCLHFTCDLACWKPCNRPPCNRACGTLLYCGHYCLGLCGEPCLSICRKCDRAEFEKIEKQLGLRLTLKSKFVVLQPCSHVIESNFMDDWVERFEKHPPCYVDSSLILKCPICEVEVTYCPRYNKATKGAEWMLGEAKRRLAESKTLKHKTNDSVECWLRKNGCDLSIGKESLDKGKDARLRLGSICILYEITCLSQVFAKRATVAYSPTLDKIGKQMVEGAPSYSKSSIAGDVIILYRIYIELQIIRLKKLIRGPNLRTILRCKQLMDSLPSLGMAVSDLLAIWKTVETVNKSLITELNRGERMDDIDDYILHLNGFYDTELNASCMSKWMCCSKGHVYSSENILAEDMIDHRCPLCYPVHDYLLKNFRSSSADDRSEKDETNLEHPAEDLTSRENVSKDGAANWRNRQPTTIQGKDTSNVTITGRKRHDLLSTSSQADRQKRNKNGRESLGSESSTLSKIDEVIRDTSCRTANKKVVSFVIEENVTRSRENKNEERHSNPVATKRSNRKTEQFASEADFDWSPDNKRRRFEESATHNHSQFHAGGFGRPGYNRHSRRSGSHERANHERGERSRRDFDVEQRYRQTSSSQSRVRRSELSPHRDNVAHNYDGTSSRRVRCILEMEPRGTYFDEEGGWRANERSYHREIYFPGDDNPSQSEESVSCEHQESEDDFVNSWMHDENCLPRDIGNYTAIYERASHERGRLSSRDSNVEQRLRRTPPWNSEVRQSELSHRRNSNNTTSGFDGTSSRQVRSPTEWEPRELYSNEEGGWRANERSYHREIYFPGDDNPSQSEESVSCEHQESEDDFVNSWMHDENCLPRDIGNYTAIYERASHERGRLSSRDSNVEQRLRRTPPWNSEVRQSELSHRRNSNNTTSGFDGTSSRQVRSPTEWEPRELYSNEEGGWRANERSYAADIYFPGNDRPFQREEFPACEHPESEDDIHLVGWRMHGQNCPPGDSGAGPERRVFIGGYTQRRTQPMNNGIWNSNSRQSYHTNNATQSYRRTSFRQFRPSGIYSSDKISRPSNGYEYTKNRDLDSTLPTPGSSQACDRPLVSYNEEFFDSLVDN